MRRFSYLAIVALMLLFSVNSAFASENSVQDDKWLIYWYISGNDLEDEFQEATIDMQEMTRTEFKSKKLIDEGVNKTIADGVLVNFPQYISDDVRLSQNVKILIQTGGCYNWANEDIPSNTIGRYLFDSNGFHYQGSFVDMNMGNAETLENFLRYGKDVIEKDFKPTRKMFIFWNHGGLAGICYDARYKHDESKPASAINEAFLDLNDVRKAFSKVYKLSEDNPPFDIIGFDACIRATYENANNIFGLAKYMIASEESESGFGWYYSDWIKKLSENPSMSNKSLGAIICQSSYDYLVKNGIDDAAISTFSTVELSKSKWLNLRAAHDSFMKNYLKSAKNNPYLYVNLESAAYSGERYGETNGSAGVMVDLKNFAENTKSRLSYFETNSSRKNSLNISADDLITAIDSVVSCNIHGENRVGSNGISIHYPLNKDSEEFELYASQNTVSKHTKKLYQNLLILSQSAPSTSNDDENQNRRSRTRSNVGRLQEILDISGLYNSPVVYDKDSNELSVSIAQDQIPKISYVNSVVLQALDTDEDNLNGLVLGLSGNIQSDWEKGKFTTTLKPTWTMINGHLVYTDILGSTKSKINPEGEILQKGYTLYGIPIELNGIGCILKVAYYPDDQKYRIIGTNRSAGGVGRVNRGGSLPKKGDVITPFLMKFAKVEDSTNEDEIKPILTIHTDDGDFAYTWIKGESFTLEEEAVVSNGVLKDGIYASSFHFNSIGRNMSIPSQIVYFNLNDGELVKEDGEFVHVADANDEEISITVEDKEFSYDPKSGDIKEES